MTTAIYLHDDCVRHEMSHGHPERPARIGAVVDALEHENLFARLKTVEAPLATREQVTLGHGGNYVSTIYDHSPDSGMVQLDADTAMNQHSLNAALRATGSGIAAIDSMLAGEIDNAFCCVRPPGHHAERNAAMGFCFFGSIAIAAKYALQQPGIERVAIIDFDVHHGNGTEDIVREDESIYFCSTFQYPFYPMKYGENIEGRLTNLPFQAAAPGSYFRDQIQQHCLPQLREFRADLILISAGFDAHADDILGGLKFLEEDYAWVTRELQKIAIEQCNGRVLSMLEGGYELASLGRSAAAHVAALMDG